LIYFDLLSSIRIELHYLLQSVDFELGSFAIFFNIFNYFQSNRFISEMRKYTSTYEYYAMKDNSTGANNNETAILRHWEDDKKKETFDSLSRGRNGFLSFLSHHSVRIMWHIKCISFMLGSQPRLGHSQNLRSRQVHNIAIDNWIEFHGDL